MLRLESAASRPSLALELGLPKAGGPAPACCRAFLLLFSLGILQQTVSLLVFLSSFHDKNQNSFPCRLTWNPKALWPQLSSLVDGSWPWPPSWARAPCHCQALPMPCAQESSTPALVKWTVSELVPHFFCWLCTLQARQGCPVLSWRMCSTCPRETRRGAQSPCVSPCLVPRISPQQPQPGSGARLCTAEGVALEVMGWDSKGSGCRERRQSPCGAGAGQAGAAVLESGQQEDASPPGVSAGDAAWWMGTDDGTP